MATTSGTEDNPWLSTGTPLALSIEEQRLLEWSYLPERPRSASATSGPR